MYVILKWMPEPKRQPPAAGAAGPGRCFKESGPSDYVLRQLEGFEQHTPWAEILST